MSPRVHMIRRIFKPNNSKHWKYTTYYSQNYTLLTDFRLFSNSAPTRHGAIRFVLCKTLLEISIFFFPFGDKQKLETPVKPPMHQPEETLRSLSFVRVHSRLRKFALRRTQWSKCMIIIRQALSDRNRPEALLGVYAHR